MEKDFKIQIMRQEPSSGPSKVESIELSMVEATKLADVLDLVLHHAEVDSLSMGSVSVIHYRR